MFIQASIWSDAVRLHHKNMRLSVLLGQSQSQSTEELVHRNMGLWGEIVGEHSGQNHEDVVGQNLWKTQENKLGYRDFTRVRENRNWLKMNFVALTLKLAGSTRSWKAWSSLRFRSPEVRSSILLTASATPPITVFPCFLTGAEPGLRSFQWEK